MEAFCHAAPVGGGLSTTGQEGNGSAQGDLLTDRELARDPAKEPAKRWRNKWFYDRAVVHLSGSIKGPGEVLGAKVWPSKDAAESKAAEQEKREPFAQVGITYLGAFPVSE